MQHLLSCLTGVKLFRLCEIPIELRTGASIASKLLDRAISIHSYTKVFAYVGTNTIRGIGWRGGLVGHAPRDSNTQRNLRRHNSAQQARSTDGHPNLRCLPKAVSSRRWGALYRQQRRVRWWSTRSCFIRLALMRLPPPRRRSALL